ncbi:unnamed protein product [Onchocerca flexuosa]|uniref:Uncharacterized protein n=1 Tax=Onchocerca flexuosa TaxID=387005 RepID=A0A183GY50_9BILA|nr:unnamed protein product [Onchocerca flexuosa]
METLESLKRNAIDIPLPSYSRTTEVTGTNNISSASPCNVIY